MDHRTSQPDKIYERPLQQYLLSQPISKVTMDIELWNQVQRIGIVYCMFF